jgi:integrase
VRVIKERDGGIVRRVRLVGDDGEPVGPVCRFLDHLGDREFSPNKLAAYGYDLKYLFIFLDREGLDWQDFRAPHMLVLLAFLRRVPSRRPAARLGLAVVADGQDGPGRLLSPATADRILAAVSSFYDWAILAEEYECGVSPVQMRADPALARVPERHEPYMGRASRQQPVRRVVQVKRPRGLPRPMNEPDLEALLSGLKRLRDLAMLLLMLDGGLRPGEVLSLHLQDISYGRRRVTIRKRAPGSRPRSVTGRSAIRWSSSPRVVAAQTLSRRSWNSSRVSRPAA